MFRALGIAAYIVGLVVALSAIQSLVYMASSMEALAGINIGLDVTDIHVARDILNLSLILKLSVPKPVNAKTRIYLVAGDSVLGEVFLNNLSSGKYPIKLSMNRDKLSSIVDEKIYIGISIGSDDYLFDTTAPLARLGQLIASAQPVTVTRVTGPAPYNATHVYYRVYLKSNAAFEDAPLTVILFDNENRSIGSATLLFTADPGDEREVAIYSEEAAAAGYVAVKLYTLTLYEGRLIG